MWFAGWSINPQNLNWNALKNEAEGTSHTAACVGASVGWAWQLLQCQGCHEYLWSVSTQVLCSTDGTRSIPVSILMLKKHSRFNLKIAALILHDCQGTAWRNGIIEKSHNPPIFYSRSIITTYWIKEFTTTRAMGSTCIATLGTKRSVVKMKVAWIHKQWNR